MFLQQLNKDRPTDVTCFIISLFTAQRVSNVSTSTFRSLRLTVDLFQSVVLLWFDVCWCYGVVRLGWCGTLMQAEALVLKSVYGYHIIGYYKNEIGKICCL